MSKNAKQQLRAWQEERVAAMKITSSEAPDIICPCCGENFTRDDYFELKEGAEVECPKCNKRLELAEEEVIRHWYWQEAK